MSRTNRPPLSLSRLSRFMKNKVRRRPPFFVSLTHKCVPAVLTGDSLPQEGKIAVLVGTVTDDIRFYDVPKLRVVALRFTERARARIVKVSFPHYYIPHQFCSACAFSGMQGSGRRTEGKSGGEHSPVVHSSSPMSSLGRCIHISQLMIHIFSAPQEPRFEGNCLSWCMHPATCGDTAKVYHLFMIHAIFRPRRPHKSWP